MKNKYRLFFFLILLLILFWWSISIRVKDKMSSENYYKNLNISVSCIVDDKEYIDHGSAIIRGQIIKSTDLVYDPRDSLSRYLFIIKNGNIEFLGSNKIETGDSVFIETKIQKIKVYSKEKLKLEMELPRLMGPQDFYDEFKRKQKL